MTPETVAALARHDVRLLAHRPEQVRVLHPGGRAMLLEPYVQLREGLYDVRRIGAYTYLGGTASSFRHIESIGRFTAMAGAIVAGQVEHGTSQLAVHPMFTGDWSALWPHLAQFYDEAGEVAQRAARLEAQAIAHRARRIVIGNDVWIGYGVFLRRGIRIGDGAVVAAHAVVVEDVPPYSVVAGVPARVIRRRFDDSTCEALLALRWWDKGLAALTGVDYTDPQAALERLTENCAHLPDWQPGACQLLPDGSVWAAGVEPALAQPEEPSVSLPDDEPAVPLSSEESADAATAPCAPPRALPGGDALRRGLARWREGIKRITT